MQRLLISACLMGEKCRYDGRDNLLPCLKRLQSKYHLVSVCPEVLGGLTTPRIPCERQGRRVINQQQIDKTIEFHQGANQVLKIAQEQDITMALLKERSPSCGRHFIYDGTFSNRLIKGQGICSELLYENGIIVYSEDDILALLGDEDCGI